jgi:hypothetical protein
MTETLDAPAAPLEAGLTSYSGLTLHRRCPQAWAYRHLRGLTRAEDEIAPWRDLGSWWHALRAVDSIERGLSLGSLRYAPRRIRTTDNGPVLARHGEDTSGAIYRFESGRTFAPSPTVILDLASGWWAALSADERDAWVETTGEDLPAALARLDLSWRWRWRDDLPNEAPLGVEVRIERPMPRSTEMFKGYVDEVYEDTSKGLIVVRDHKAKKALPTMDTRDDLLDSQLHLYTWGVLPILTEWGFTPHATAYDRIRSAPPKQPQVTQAGTLSKSVTDYDVATYLDWAAGGVPYPGRKKDGSDGGTYVAEAAVAERLRSPAVLTIWHQRTLVPLNGNIIRAHLLASADTLADAQRTQARFAATGQAAHNFGDACRFCDFAALCRAELIGGVEGEYPPEAYGLMLIQPRREPPADPLPR